MSRLSRTGFCLFATALPVLSSGAATAAASIAPADAPAFVRPAAVNPGVTVTAPVVTNGFVQPTGVTSAKDGSNRLFILEKAGRVRVFNQATGQRSTFVDLTDRVSTDGERGLLGMAFAPDFATSHQVYLSFTRKDLNLQVTRFTTTANSGTATLDKASGFPIITVPHPPNASNHYAGHVEFGTDGLLYISTGDGGTTPQNAQRVDNLSGKILRIDPRMACNGRPYCIPPTNPYYNTNIGKQQIWLSGLRNPFQFSINDNGDVWIGDVGQNTYEEIDRRNQSEAGANFGWNCLEAYRVNDASRCFAATRIPPYSYYGRALGNSVTGGRVYHGSRFPALQGLYVFGDFGSGRLFLINPANGLRYDKGIKLDGVTGFGESDVRELYAVTIDGSLHQIMAV